MALEQWRPFGSSSSNNNNEENVPARRRSERPFQRLQQEMNRLFENFFQGSAMQRPGEARRGTPARRGSSMTSRGQFWPRIDISEDASQLKVSAELPGMSQSDVEITASDDAMTIEGEKSHETEEEDENFHRTERSYGYFKRTIPMPANVDIDGAEATFRDGVLNVRVPKTGEGREGRTLEISAE